MDKDTRICYERWGFKVTGEIVQHPLDTRDPATLEAKDNADRIHSAVRSG